MTTTLAEDRKRGAVKWFSNSKGYGFIVATAAADETTSVEDEIFVHHTKIIAPPDAYRTLVEGAEVEFELEKDSGGKLMAVNVTAPGGTPLEPPPRRKKTTKNGGDDGDGDGGRLSKKKGGKTKASAAREPPFHSVIAEDVKERIKERGIDLNMKSTVDVSIGGLRIKLGQGGYAGLASADGTVAEGSYQASDSAGLIKFTWERCLSFSDGEWKTGNVDSLVATLSLTDESVGPVAVDETPEKLWGPGVTDPKESFEKHGFLMRRVVLTRPPRGRKS